MEIEVCSSTNRTNSKFELTNQDKPSNLVGTASSILGDKQFSSSCVRYSFKLVRPTVRYMSSKTEKTVFESDGGIATWKLQLNEMFTSIAVKNVLTLHASFGYLLPIPRSRLKLPPHRSPAKLCTQLMHPRAAIALISWPQVWLRPTRGLEKLPGVYF